MGKASYPNKIMKRVSKIPDPQKGLRGNYSPGLIQSSTTIVLNNHCFDFVKNISTKLIKNNMELHNKIYRVLQNALQTKPYSNSTYLAKKIFFFL